MLNKSMLMGAALGVGFAAAGGVTAHQLLGGADARPRSAVIDEAPHAHDAHGAHGAHTAHDPQTGSAAHSRTQRLELDRGALRSDATNALAARESANN